MWGRGVARGSLVLCMVSAVRVARLEFSTVSGDLSVGLDEWLDFPVRSPVREGEHGARRVTPARSPGLGCLWTCPQGFRSVVDVDPIAFAVVTREGEVGARLVAVARVAGGWVEIVEGVPVPVDFDRVIRFVEARELASVG